MPEPAWLGYTGAITGIIGAVTGISGAIMGYISYRHSEKLKALDLRLELRKADHDTREAVTDLRPLLDNARKSHDAVLSATGQLQSGAQQRWTMKWDESLLEVKALEENLPDPAADYIDLDHAAIETKLVANHATHHKATKIRDRYRGSLESDDKEREQIRADLRGSVNRGH